MVALTRAGQAALAGLALAWGASAAGQALRGSVELRSDVYPRSALYPDQSPDRSQPAALARLQGAASPDADTDLVFSGRVARTPSAQQKSSGDIGQAYVERRFGAWAARAGVLDERWGVLDAWNPANVYNQLDLRDDYKGGTRLGQPGLTVKYSTGGWTWSLLGARLARERRLPDGRDRYRLAPLRIEGPTFEKGRRKPSVAARAAYRGGGPEVAVSHYRGLSREPEFAVVPRNDGPPVLRKDYRMIDQSSVEGQYVLGDYVLRGEAIRRSGQTGPSFFGAGLGVERIVYSAFGGPQDLQMFVEVYRDDRPGTAPVTSFQNDLSIGGRLILNDPASTELGARVTIDLAHGSKLLEASARRRVFGDYVLGVDLTAPADAGKDPALAAFRRDTRLPLGITRFF